MNRGLHRVTCCSISAAGVAPLRRTAPDVDLLKQRNIWLDDTQKQSIFAAIAAKARDVVTAWVAEHWDIELVKEGGVTAAENESSVVLYGDYVTDRVLLTADAGVNALRWACLCHTRPPPPLTRAVRSERCSTSSRAPRARSERPASPCRRPAQPDLHLQEGLPQQSALGRQLHHARCDPEVQGSARQLYLRRETRRQRSHRHRAWLRVGRARRHV